MATPSFTQLTLVDGNTAHASDINSQMAGVASYLGNDAVTTDNLLASGGITYLSTDGTDLVLNVPNIGGGKKLRIKVGGVLVASIDASGNARFLGTVTASVAP